ncbi:MAG: hypothetical protein HRU20_02320 [Pseudomonadales bacterium]|nr:hypothetical protein [Pseudomonadales bacterium]
MVNKIPPLLWVLIGFLGSVNGFCAELELTSGINYYSLQSDIQTENVSKASYILSAKLRGQHGDKQQHYLGTGLDIIDINNMRLLGFRAVDYQWAMTKNLRLGAFIGAASLANKTPQNGYYLGINLSAPRLYRNLGLILEISMANGLARDILPSDPATRSPDTFIDIYMSSLSLAWSF